MGIKKIKASALHFAILISVIVAIILSCFLLLTHTLSSFKIQSHKVVTNIEVSNKAFQYYFKNDNMLIDSLNFEIGNTSVLLSKTYWGSFEKVVSIGGMGTQRFEKIALLGSYEPSTPTGMYLEDNNLPLVLAGKTHIEGTSFAPGDMIKPGNIAGNYFNGSQLINGQRHNSETSLPSLDHKWRSYVENILANKPNNEESIIGLENLKNSFFEKRIMIYSSSKIFVDHQLLGNIIVKSETEIQVSEFAELDQIILVAPKVIVDSNFRGNLHIISENVQVGKNANLNYPSSIIVIKKSPVTEFENFEMEPKIIIGMNSTIEGNIIYLNTEGKGSPQPDIMLNETSVVEGNIYCQGYLDIRGTVKGSVFTKYFVAQQHGSLYINHIYNARILNEGKKPDISGLLLEGKRKNIASWLY